MVNQTALRPIERRVLRLEQSGLAISEIASRFRRSPNFIERVIEMAKVPGRTGASKSPAGLRPLERRVLKLRGDGVAVPLIATQFRRSPGFIRRVEEMAKCRSTDPSTG